MGPSSPSAASSHDQEHGSIGMPAQATSDNANSDSMSVDDDTLRGAARNELDGTAVEDGKEGKQTNSDAEEARPVLPPRPSLLPSSGRKSSAYASKPTTALSSVDIQTLSFPDGSRGTFSTPAGRSVSDTLSLSGVSGGQSTPSRKVSRNGSEVDDSASLMSYAPTLKANGDLASLLEDGLSSQSPAWRLLSTQTEDINPFEQIDFEDLSLVNFDHEFDELEAVDHNGENGGLLWNLLLHIYGTDCCQRMFCFDGRLNTSTISSYLLPANRYTADMATRT